MGATPGQVCSVTVVVTQELRPAAALLQHIHPCVAQAQRRKLIGVALQEALDLGIRQGADALAQVFEFQVRVEWIAGKCRACAQEWLAIAGTQCDKCVAVQGALLFE